MVEEAHWTIELNVECPFCNTDVDLTQYPGFWDGRSIDDLLNIRNEIVICPECGYEVQCNFNY